MKMSGKTPYEKRVQLALSRERDVGKEEFKKLLNEAYATIAEYRKILEGYHTPLNHDYIKDEKQCEICKLLASSPSKLLERVKLQDKELRYLQTFMSQLRANLTELETKFEELEEPK